MNLTGRFDVDLYQVHYYKFRCIIGGHCMILTRKTAGRVFRELRLVTYSPDDIQCGHAVVFGAVKNS